MSFGPQTGRRRQADAGTRIARLTRRALLTGGCAVAGWIGVSLLGGGAAHAATAHSTGQSPVTAIVNQLPTDKQHGLSGITDLARRTISAHPTKAVHLASIQKSIGDVERRLPKSINDQVDKTTKPITRQVTDQVVTPVSKVATQATRPLTNDNPISQTVSSVQKPVGQLTKVLHRTTTELHLPGITVPTSKSPQTPHLPVVGTPVAHRPVTGGQLARAGRHHATAHRAHRRAVRHLMPTTGGFARVVGHSIPQVATTRSIVPIRAGLQHPRHLRIPAPNAPPAPGGVPALNAGTGGGTSGSGPVGGATVGALDSAAEAGFRALGTVDPTDAGMARCVAQRPSASPD